MSRECSLFPVTGYKLLLTRWLPQTDAYIFFPIITQTNGSPFRMFNVNHQPLNKNKWAWINLLTTTHADITVATEAWLDGTIRNSKLECDGFNIYRKDRNTDQGGGIMIQSRWAVGKTQRSCRPKFTVEGTNAYSQLHATGPTPLIK